MKNIACNLIYNDGDEGVKVGFNGRCSIQNIIYNVEKNSSRWCNQEDCTCNKYYNSGFKRGEVDFPCNESEVFSKWIWTPGGNFKTKEPFIIRFVGKGKVAILTTGFSNTPESERKIVGFFKIDDVTEDGHCIHASRKFRLRLTLDEAKQLNYWSYYRNEGNPKLIRWSQPRFRYLEDMQVAAILHDILSIVHDASTKSMVAQLLKTDFPIYSDNRPTVKGAIDNDTVKKTFLERKYGKGGESKEHKALKKHIASHPELIGLSKSQVRSIIEHNYISGDLVDILFEPIKGNQNTVVEIELDNVMPGIHQAIKYRALRCSQLGYELNSELVNATVVAWKFNESEKKLCKKYGIDFYAIKL